MPKGTEPEKPRPMITLVHGGPSSASFAHFPGREFRLRCFRPAISCSSQPARRIRPGGGLYPPRIGELAAGLADILAGAEEAARKFPVDVNRLGDRISYGGFMTMWDQSRSAAEEFLSASRISSDV